MYCLCVNVYYHRVTTQLQLINISHQLTMHGMNTKSTRYVWIFHWRVNIGSKLETNYQFSNDDVTIYVITR
jgi:hypothetical protein